MSEIQWLINILMTCKLTDSVKKKFIARIGEVEAKLTSTLQVYRPAAIVSPSGQAASTQRILNEMASDGMPASPAVIAQTPATAAALAQRENLIKSALSSKPEAGRTSPRKF